MQGTKTFGGVTGRRASQQGVHQGDPLGPVSFCLPSKKIVWVNRCYDLRLSFEK